MPIPNTQWRSYYFDFSTHSIGINESAAASQASYKADGDGVTVYSQAMTEDTTIVGPVFSTLWISSSATDADHFLVLNAVGPDGELVELRDHRTGLIPMTEGWLLASHRALDPERSTPWQPYQSHTSSVPLGWVKFTRLILNYHLPAGYRLCITSGRWDRIVDVLHIFLITVTVLNATDMKSQLFNRLLLNTIITWEETRND